MSTVRDATGADEGAEEAGAPAATAPPPTPRPRRTANVVSGRGDVVALAGLVAVTAVLWGRGGGTWYWTDEGLSLGISSHSVAGILDVVRQDTAPPLYHLLLHGWTEVVGSSERATHGLSLVFALAVIPAALWAGRSLFDRRTGWMCAALAALSPFLATYANETRMYSMVAVLSVLATATFLHAFVFGRRRFLAPFVVLLTLTLYTHYWGLFLTLGAATAAVVCVVHAADRRRLATDAVLAFGAVGLLFAPWLPTLAYQRAHSAVAWSVPPTLQVVRDDIVGLVGGPVPAVALALGAGAALTVLLRWPWDRASLAIAAAVVMGVIAVAAGVATSRTSSQWHARYLGIALAPVLLTFGAALARAGPVALPVLAVVGVLSGPIAVKVPLHAKSNVKGWAGEAAPSLRRGDVVFAPIGGVPLLAHYLPDGLRYATTTGPVADPLAADWRDALERLDRSDPAAILSPFVDTLAVGGHVLVSCPPAEGYVVDDLPVFIRTEIRRCLEGQGHLLGDPRLEVVMSLRYPASPDLPVAARLLRKLPPQPGAAPPG